MLQLPNLAEMPALASRDASQLAAARMGGAMSTTTFASALQEWCSPGSLTIVTNAGLICFGACFNDIHFSFLVAYFLKVQSFCGAWNRPNH